MASDLKHCLLIRSSPFLAIIFVSLLLSIAAPCAETNLNIPAEYGEVIYQSNAESPNQVFIIGMSHRDSLTRANGGNTSRVQAEVYQIGNWLIHTQGVRLLLPEGFFKNPSAPIGKLNVPDSTGSCADLPDLKALEAKLSDDQTYVNAEMLLKEDHSLRVRQVEDLPLYREVRDGLLKLVSGGGKGCDPEASIAALDYLQAKRTAVMLQNIPQVVEEEFRQGTIRNEKAIFTVGMSHLNSIIQYLKERKITVSAPPLPSNGYKDYMANLDLQKENFGIFVILPKTLACDPEILRINQLDQITVQPRLQPSALHP